MSWALAVACALAAVPAGLRWLRVAQREHYLPPSTSRFAWRWWSHGPANTALGLVAIAGLIGSIWSTWLGFAVVLAQVGPVGLGVRGRTSPLAWTDRLVRLAILTGALAGLGMLMGAVAGIAPLTVAALLLLPGLVDLALVFLSPLEKRLGARWIKKAALRLQSSGAEVVAITGSYGKTSTKGYVTHLLGGKYRVVASPASFNNRMGLARAINEQLVPGTQIFVAEMGTYGPGEIAELCSWIPPKVSAIVAIGPVHLERFGSEENIVAAKSEILDRAQIGVLAVDHPLLARLAEERGDELELILVGSESGRVSIADGELVADGESLGALPAGALAINACVAVGVCLALGVDPSEIARRLPGIPVAEHRQTVTASDVGVIIIDDTYNSNPAGAASALDTLARVSDGGRTAVVTPGMVELGARQQVENEAFARRAAAEADDLVVVGGTNRRALLRGSASGPASVTVVRSREEAVAWVRKNLARGDAVLYENDLPDHYP